LPARAQTLLSLESKTALGDYHPQSIVADAMKRANTDDPLAGAQFADLMTWLPGRMLTKVDRASMAHSLEARPPLLDHQLVEWAGMLPSDFKIAHGERKRILKTALTPRLGEDYVTRPKRGFNMPVSDWLRDPESALNQRLKYSMTWRESGYVDENAVERMMKVHQNGGADCGQELWSVVMFDAFLKARP
jgi:asparagine synthase (glutamine-hydrolysing)